MKRLFLKIASFVYGAGVGLRNMMFDMGLLRSTEYDIPVICVGNITAGGTGKTPVVEMLVAYFSALYDVAVLSRGYGRVTRGYREVGVGDRCCDVGDEPLQVKRKFPAAKVIVCGKRRYAIERIRREHPEVNLIIMDDGFQHRYVKPFINIITVDATRPFEEDSLLPVGMLRDRISSLHRAHYFLVTKCPDTMTPMDARIQRDKLVQAPYQSLYFTRIAEDDVRPVFDGVRGAVKFGSEVVAMCGIGNSDVFIDGLRRRFDLVHTIVFDDHYRYRTKDLAEIGGVLERYPGAVVIMTEKDAVKFFNSSKVPQQMRQRLFYESIRVEFIDGLEEEFLGRLDNDLKQHNNGTYIRGC